jgi:hypothetical protein
MLTQDGAGDGDLGFGLAARRGLGDHGARSTRMSGASNAATRTPRPRGRTRSRGPKVTEDQQLPGGSTGYARDTGADLSRLAERPRSGSAMTRRTRPRPSSGEEDGISAACPEAMCGDQFLRCCAVP